MPTPTDTELHAAKVVDEDLGYLMAEWRPRLEPPELRRLSPVLRRLLADGDYAKAWRALGLPGRPAVDASDLNAMLGTIDCGAVKLALAPPAKTANAVLQEASMYIQPSFPIASHDIGRVWVPVLSNAVGLGIAIVTISANGLPEDGPERDAAAHQAARAALGSYVVSRMTIGQYLDSPAVVACGQMVSRRDVIYYVANKLGGAHFDDRREDKRCEVWKLLDRHPLLIEATDASPIGFVYVELLSIAETLAMSADAERFRDTYRRHAAHLKDRLLQPGATS